MEPVSAEGPATAIYVVGSSRSGTTLMGRILGRHPLVLTFEELHFFERVWDPTPAPVLLPREEGIVMVSRLLAFQRLGFPWGGDPGQFREEAQQVLDLLPADGRHAYGIYRALLGYETARAGKRIPCEQTPRNVFFLRDIARLEPGARIVNMVRDPRDVLLSQKNRWKRRWLGGNRLSVYEALRSRVNYHPITITKLWAAAIDAGDACADHPGVVTVRFADLVAAPESEMRRVCHALGLAFTPDLLAVPRIGSSREADEPERVGIRQSAAQPWIRGGLSREEVYLCERVAARQMMRHQFSPSGTRPRLVPLAWQAIQFPLHLAGVVLFNFTRIRNPFAALGRRFGAKQAASPET